MKHWTDSELQSVHIVLCDRISDGAVNFARSQEVNQILLAPAVRGALQLLWWRPWIWLGCNSSKKKLLTWG